MGIREFLFGSKSTTALGELPRQSKGVSDEDAARKALLEAFAEMSQGGVDADVIPGGVGEFGLSVDNPVPCHTVLGSYAYLARLRFDGREVVAERIGSFRSAVVTGMIDGYEIKKASGGDLGTVYLSAYHKRNSALAPRGFSLAD